MATMKKLECTLEDDFKIEKDRIKLSERFAGPMKIKDILEMSRQYERPIKWEATIGGVRYECYVHPHTDPETESIIKYRKLDA